MKYSRKNFSANLRKTVKKTKIKGKQLEFYMENIFEKYNSIYYEKFRGIRLETPFIQQGGKVIRTQDQPADYIVITPKYNFIFDTKECSDEFFNIRNKDGTPRKSIRHQINGIMQIKNMGFKGGLVVWFKSICPAIQLAESQGAIRFISDLEEKKVSVKSGIPFSPKIFMEYDLCMNKKLKI